MASFATRPSLNQQVVDEVMLAARKRAEELGGRFTIVVLDHAAALRSVCRLDAADLATIELALGKARMSAFNGLPTGIWKDAIGQDGFLATAIPLALERAVGGATLFAGGYPLQVQGTTTGSLGVSGGSEQEDDDVARTGLAAAHDAEQFRADAQ